MGNSTLNGAVTGYSIIEIGSTILQKVGISRALDNFLQSALQSNGETTLYVQRDHAIVGLRTSDGKCYFTKPVGTDVLISIVVGVISVICLLFGLLGFDPSNHALFILLIPGIFSGRKAISLWQMATEHKRLAAELAATGGIAIDA